MEFLREIMGKKQYSELHAMSNFSFLQAASHPEELIHQASSFGMKAIAITDINSVTGLVRAHLAAKDKGIKLVIGARLTFEDGPDLLIYPTNKAAYGCLTKLLTLGKRRAVKGSCKLYLSDLNKSEFCYGEGQIVIVVPPSDIFVSTSIVSYKIRCRNKQQSNHISFFEIKKTFKKQLFHLKKFFKEFVYLSVSYNYSYKSKKRISALSQLSTFYNIPLVATNDVLIHSPSRKPLLDVITCIRNGVTIHEAGYLLGPNAERHLKSPNQMAKLFLELPDAILRTSEIVDLCQFSLDELSYEYPCDLVPFNSTLESELSRLVSEGAKKRYPSGVPKKVFTQIKYELKIINSLGFAPYFLTVYDIIRYAESQNIFCQGRGSAANSVVCYCLGITAVDPNRIELLFERFISADRGEPPDIDIDFENGRREEVIQYIYKKYGREKASMTATVITYKTKGALREVGKVLGLSEDNITTLQKISWRRCLSDITDKHIQDFGLDPTASAIRMTIFFADEIRSFPRHLSQHTGGMVISNRPLCEIVPIANAAMAERTVIEWDKNDLDTLGILKIDILALGMLTCIHKAFDLISSYYGKVFDLANIPSEDPMVYSMLCKADAVGVFQVESRAQMSMLPRLKPRSFYDLVIEVAIVRPGPIQGDMVHPYLRRRNGKESIYIPSKKLNPILKKTLGVPLFQEQAMKIAIVAANFTPQEADRLRRTLSTFRNSNDINILEKKFLYGMKRNGYDSNFAKYCFKQIASFSNYGFPESHAASFALLVYISSWIKCHYPAVFTCALLNSQPMGFYAPAQLIRDAKAHGVEVKPICINASYWDCTLESSSGGPILRLGFRQIKGIRKSDILRLIELRNTPFKNISNLYFRTKLSKVVLEYLAQADVFHSLEIKRHEAVWEIKGIDDNNSSTLFANIKKQETQVNLSDLCFKREVIEDYKTTRLSLKSHPLATIRAKLTDIGYNKCNILASTDLRKKVRISGLLITRQQPASAKGIIFITIEDESAFANLIVLPNILEKFRYNILAASILGVTGTVQREGIVTHVLVEEAVDLSTLMQ